MNENKLTDYLEADVREEALRQARAEMAEEVKQEIVDIFRELLERLWERLVSLIGETATAAIFHSAKLEVTRGHPFLDGVEVDEAGIHLDRLGASLGGLDRAALRAGLLAFMDSIMALLTDLTGDILVRKVESLVEQFKQQLDREA